MGRNPQDVTEAELSVLRVLWQSGPATIRQITEQVYPQNSESDYATVKKLLSRLERKKCVRRDRTQIAHLFEPLVTLDDLVGRRLQVLADNLCDGSRTPLLMHLLRTDEITAEQQQQLRDLVDQLSASKRRQPQQKKRRR